MLCWGVNGDSQWGEAAGLQVGNVRISSVEMKGGKNEENRKQCTTECNSMTILPWKSLPIEVSIDKVTVLVH